MSIGDLIPRASFFFKVKRVDLLFMTTPWLLLRYHCIPTVSGKIIIPRGFLPGKIKTPGTFCSRSESMDEALRRNAAACRRLTISSSSNSSSSASVLSEEGDDSAGEWSRGWELVGEITCSGVSKRVGVSSTGPLGCKLPEELETVVRLLPTFGEELGVGCLAGETANARTGFGKWGEASLECFGLC